MEKIQSPGGPHKRKFDDTELEVDINAPEPPSKKALRKAKKVKTSGPEGTAPAAEEANLKLLNGPEGARSEYGIWIGNLSFTTTKKDLYKFLLTNKDFSLPAEQITRIHVPAGTDRHAQNKGFAYVDLASQELVEKALQLSESLLGGRRLLIKDAKNFQGRPETSRSKAEVLSRPPNRKIFVGNLAYEATVEEVEKHFGVCGSIRKTNLATWPDSGRCKGYGWIEFESLPSAETAMRGWAEVQQSRKRKGEPEGDTLKKVWLTRMGDRRVKLEYAEDATTRYNKRYGKASKSNKPKDVDTENPSEDLIEDSTSKPTRPGRSSEGYNKHRRKDSKAKKESNSRYDEQTVQKLTGAMVDGQGSKVKFE